eukprot:gene25088-biopygen22466
MVARARACSLPRARAPGRARVLLLPCSLLLPTETVFCIPSRGCKGGDKRCSGRMQDPTFSLVALRGPFPLTTCIKHTPTFNLSRIRPPSLHPQRAQRITVSERERCLWRSPVAHRGTLGLHGSGNPPVPGPVNMAVVDYFFHPGTRAPVRPVPHSGACGSP